MKMAIGNFEFINLSRVPSGPMHRFSRETRAGVNGCTLWQTGRRSETVQVMSVVDAGDVNSATALLRSYEALTEQDPVPLFFANDQLNGLTAKVINVEPVEEGCYATVIGIGGTRGTSNAMLRVIWTLQPIHPAKEARA